MENAQESTPLLPDEKCVTTSTSYTILREKHTEDLLHLESYNHNDHFPSSIGNTSKSDSEITELVKPQNPQTDSEVNSVEGKGRTKWSTIITLLTLVFLTYCIDMCVISFFTDMALQKGLQESQVGVIFSSYDIGRFLGASFIAYRVS